MSLELVIVEWNDAWGDEEPVSLDSVDAVHKPLVVRTIGWLLKSDDAGVSLANECYDNSYRGRSFIPKAMIKSVTPYKLVKPRKPSPERRPSPDPADGK